MSGPYCLAHGKLAHEHEHGRCLYCCICFEQLTPEKCAVDTDGQRWDVCAGLCAREAGISEGEERAVVLPRDPERVAFVSHFATCPDASKHRLR